MSRLIKFGLAALLAGGFGSCSNIPESEETSLEVGSEVQRKVLENYLKTRVMQLEEEVGVLKAHYNEGLINSEEVATPQARLNFYQTSLGAVKTGNFRNIEGIVLEYVRNNNHLALGVERDLLKKSLDDRYKKARESLEVIERRIEAGISDGRDRFLPEGVLTDLEWAYSVHGLEVPKAE